MDRQNSDLGRVLDAIERMRDDLARLESRVAHLERGPGPTEDARARSPMAETDHIDAETVMTIAAAVAAFLGEKPRIRAIRLLRSDAWAQEGRTTIQAWYSVSPPP